MIYSIDGRLVKIDGNLLERRVKTLTYQIQGGWFPQSYYNSSNDSNIIKGNEYIHFRSRTPNSVVVNYGDGNTYTKVFEASSVSGYIAGYELKEGGITSNWAIPQHEYTDGFEGIRNVTFEFENPLAITEVNFRFIQLRGSLPTEISFFNDVEVLRYSSVQYLERVPDSFPSNLDEYTLSTALIEKEEQIPDSLFNTRIKKLSINGSYNLSDNISSNFFKINQLKDTLTNLSVENCNIIEFPDSIKECILINDLRATGNEYEAIPTEVNSLVNLTRLYLGSDTLTDTSMPYWDNLKDLRSLVYGFPQADLSAMPEAWSKLYYLLEILSFNSFILTNARFDEFIDNFYELSTVNGTILGDAPAPYPNRFRNIAWGHGSLSFTGAKEAPAGYVQGVSNGTPTTQGEKAYVLQNQYNHTITHA